MTAGMRWLARLIAAAGLGVDVYVHWHLASGYDAVRGHGSPHISQGGLFRVEAALALVALILVLMPRRWTAGLAFLVAAGGVAAVLLYRYVDVGVIGPIPNMYEPLWYTEKTVSAVAEGIAALACLFALGSAPSQLPASRRRRARALRG
jgi:hypothetical protein